MSTITTVEQLETLYGIPVEAATAKEINYISPYYGAMIKASPFTLLATVGPEGLDCSPRGDMPGFVRIHVSRTLMLPDRRGNNRVDSLRNIVRDPRVAMLFIIPGVGNTLRVNGRAIVSIEPALLASFAIEGKLPRSVLVINIDTVFFQCARALIRADLWNTEKHAAEASLPSAGQILASLTEGCAGGESYDQAWPDRARQTMW